MGYIICFLDGNEDPCFYIFDTLTQAENYIAALIEDRYGDDSIDPNTITVAGILPLTIKTEVKIG